MSSEEVYIDIPNAKGGSTIVFYCPTDLLAYRAETLFTKEPETIEWIDSFDFNSILWDIGANIGCYSLYAGMKGIKVMAFEPQCANYYILNRNINLNNLDDVVSAYCIAFSRRNQLDSLNMPRFDFGASLNSFGKPVDELIAGDYSFYVSFRQGSIGFSIDQFVEQFNVSIPNYIKIDVDGIEDEIIFGARNTLTSPELNSVLVEMDEKDKVYVRSVTDFLLGCGLHLVSKRHSVIVENGAFKSNFNYIFKKNDNDMSHAQEMPYHKV